MTALSTLLGEVPAGAAYPVLAAAVLAESVLLIGAFVPTLTLLLTAGALARTGHLHLLPVVATAAGAVVTGDFLAHRTGGVLGAGLHTTGVGRRIPTAAWQRAEDLMTRRGGQALLVTRFVPVIRTVTPHVAGATRVPYRSIAPYSALAAPLWAGAEAGAGYAAAPSLQRAFTLGAPAVAALLITVGGAVLWTKARTGTRGRPTGTTRRSRAPTRPGRLPVRMKDRSREFCEDPDGGHLSGGRGLEKSSQGTGRCAGPL